MPTNSRSSMKVGTLAQLQAVLANRRSRMSDRASAATELGFLATPAAENALLRQARLAEPRLQQQVLAALGPFAGPRAARTLGKLAAPVDGAAYRQLAFATALIAHRHGLDGPFLVETPLVLRERGTEKQLSAMKMRTRNPKSLRSVRDRFHGRDYGIKFGDRVLSIDCGPLRWELLLNRELGRSTSTLASLHNRAWIAGVLALWMPGKEALNSRYVVLTRPVGDAIRIDVARPDGEIVYVGTAASTKEGMTFRISDTVRPGTSPLNLSGTVTATGLRHIEAVSWGSRVAKREALPVAFPT